MNKIFFLISMLSLAALVPLTLTASAAGTLHFKPESNATVAANHFITINGTSSSPNPSVNKHCNVEFQTNGHGYKPVTPAAPGNYSKWSTISSEMMKVGVNSLEGQIMCFAPGISGNATATPNYTHHLNHNVIGR